MTNKELKEEEERNETRGEVKQVKGDRIYNENEERQTRRN